MRHDHYPTNISHRYAVPFANKERSVCGSCGKPIVFVEGYELRRDYWKAITRQGSATDDVQTPATDA